MNKTTWMTMLFTLPAFTFALLLTGCSNPAEKADKDKPSSRPKTVAKKSTGSKGKEAETLSADLKSTVKGNVVYDGTPPTMPPIDAMKQHNDKNVCLMGNSTETHAQEWIVSKDGAVENVVVWLEAPEGKKFAEKDSAKKEVEIDQPHCAYVPHVVAVGPNQKVKFLNNAAVPHNVKTEGDPTINESVAIIVNPGQSIVKDFQPQDEPIGLKCDFHKWMSGWIWVKDNPYIAVSKEDGTFEISDVPTGVELKVIGWHEARKRFYTGTLTTKAGENVLDLKISAK